MPHKQTLTKSELTRLIKERVNIDQNQIKPIIQAAFDSMKATLKEGRRIEIRGFGSFSIKRKVGRSRGINPFTRERMGKSPDHSVVIFKPGRVLRELVWNIKNE